MRRRRLAGPPHVSPGRLAVACGIVLGMVSVDAPWAAARAGPAREMGTRAGGVERSPGCAGTWPMYQHDPAHSADASCATVSPANVASLHPAWFSSTGQAAVTAEPAVSGGSLYVGDAAGTVHALDAATGARRWNFSIVSTHSVCGGVHVPPDMHATSYGGITSSVAVAQVPGGRRTVFVGGGGTLYALDAANGACEWARDLDPQNPKSAMEILSSPVVNTQTNPPEVIVGSDSNESPRSSAPPGVQAFDATDGDLLWKFEPERSLVVHTLDSPPSTDGCGDVWSSPALDPSGSGGRGLVVFGTGNCPDPQSVPAGVPNVESIFALDAGTGTPVWAHPFSEPPNQYSGPNLPDEGDDDFGASPVIVSGGTTRRGAGPLVLAGSKSGYVYALDEASGAEVWQVQAAQPGQTGDKLAGAIGGFIGSPALGAVGDRPTLFLTSAIPAPFSQVRSTDPTPDTSLLCLDGNGAAMRAAPGRGCDPMRAASLHAVDVATGRVVWQAVTALPSYAAATYAGGVVFAPATTAFSEEAYDAATGRPVWSMPLAAAPSSGTAIVGGRIYFGAGTSGLFPAPVEVPPQGNGIWCVTTASSS